jgi:hypothetical protein
MSDTAAVGKPSQSSIKALDGAVPDGAKTVICVPFVGGGFAAMSVVAHEPAGCAETTPYGVTTVIGGTVIAANVSDQSDSICTE